MTTRTITAERLQHPKSQAAFNTVKTLISIYLGISIVTVLAMILLHSTILTVTPAVWVRSIIVIVHAGVTVSFAARMARGSRVGYILLSLSSAIMVVAIAIILALPGDFPLWFKIEQGVCGLLLLGVVLIVNGGHLRATFWNK